MQTNKTKVALITGANTGVGFQIAKALADKNYIVYVGSRDLQKGEAAAKEIGTNARVMQLDITNTDAVNAAVAKVQEEFGYLSLLVNNAAISHAGKAGRTMEEILGAQKPSIAPIAELQAVRNTNLFSTLAITQAFLPLLRETTASRIVIVSSALGSLTANANPHNPYRSAFDAVYGTSKNGAQRNFFIVSHRARRYGNQSASGEPGIYRNGA